MVPSIPRSTVIALQKRLWLALFFAVSVACVLSTTAMAQTVSSFTLSSSASSITLSPGASNSGNPLEIDVTYLNGFGGRVSLTASGLPAGVTAAFPAASIQTDLLIFTVGGAAVPGRYPITVTGTSGTLKSTTATVLTISAPSFSLSSSASSLNLLVGGTSAASSIAVTAANGFNSSVALTASGLPTGVAAKFSSATTTGKSTLTLTPAATAAPGSYQVKVTGTAGQNTNSVTIALTIPTPSFSLSSSASALTLIAGGSSASSAIGVLKAVGLSNNDVNVTMSGVPTGVTAKLNWPTASPTTTITATFAASSTVTPGNYNVTLTGTSGTATSKSVIALTIPGPSFSLSASANSITLLEGQDGWNLPIDISVVNATGLANKVSLTASGVPAGVTSAFTAVNASTLGLTFNVSKTAAAGTYPVTVKGVSGTASSTTTIALTIPPANFSIAASVTDLTVVAGGSAADTVITVTGQDGFSSNVNLVASGLPTGVTATFSSAVTGTKSTLAFTAGATAVPGTYAVTITGTSGGLTRTTAVVLTIPASNFTLSSSPSALSLLTGAGTSSTITVTGTNGSHSNVTLAAKGLPAGVTATFSPDVTSTTSLLTFTASSAVVPGTYSVTVTGTAGTITNTVTISLKVPVPGFSLSSSPSALSLVAGGPSANSTISVVGVNGFNGVVALTTTGVPANVSATFSSAKTSTTSTLAFAANSAAVPGTYTVTVTGTSGTLTSTATIVLTFPGPISIAVTQPTFGFNVLPGSVRRIYATVTNGVTDAVNWSVTGGATLSSNSGHWVDVTAPATGNSCSITGGVGSYAITSAKRFTLTAQSEESPGQTASITINVCNPAVQINVVPFYTTLYSGQKADIQAFVWGSVNKNVTWAITSQPNGGNGTLADTVNQDTAFSATVAGHYTLTATSVADSTKTNTATIYVTGHEMTYQVTPSETMPVDCTVDPALTGKTYEVGPSQTYKTIQSVPWTSLAAGSTVRIHNEDTTGSSPTTYHEYFQLATEATRTQPVRVCGVPDSRGNLPVIDASNATGRSDVNVASAGYTAVGIGTPGWGGVYTGTWNSPQYLIVEGLKIQNAKQSYLYTTPAGAAGTAWIKAAACVRLFRSMNTVVRGIDAYNCGNGFFSDFNANEGFAAVANTLYEGNHLHNNGVSGDDSEHQFYIQGWNEVAQFNVIDDYQSGARGSNFKGRGFPEVVRYNHLGDGAARELDMVDNQDAQPYTTFEGYLSGTTSSYRSRNVGDAYTADLLAAAVEAHHADYVYGNTFVNTTAAVPIHYSTDHGALEDDRVGTLWFYNNSFYEPVGTDYSWNLFDTSGGGGDDFAEIEWPQIQAVDNAIWMDSTKEPYFNWNVRTNQFTTFGRNALNSNWGTNNMTGGNGTGWASLTSKYAFQGASNSADTIGLSNLVVASEELFNVTTFVPNAALINAGTSLPANAPKLPVRFQYGPTAVQVVRDQPLTMGAME
ncbi:MAG TPA: hypothetical protein VGG56_06135 [Terracidiphilus sp.]|jgi:uncharacterized membrane protein